MNGKEYWGSYRGERRRAIAYKKLRDGAASGKTCSAYANKCRRDTNHSPKCETRYLGCMNTGVYVGSKVTYPGMIRQ